MPQKCETISYCSPTPYREPRKHPFIRHQICRFTTMHLKPYPKPQDKEPHQEGGQVGTENHLVGQRGTLRTGWGVRQAQSLLGSPGNGTVNRCPLSVISSNTFRCPTNSGTLTTKASAACSYFWSHKNKTFPSVTTFPNSVVLLSSSPGVEDESSLKIYQGEDGEASLDIWAVIKPGNTKEKIAMFTAQKCSSADPAKIDKGPEKGITLDLRTVSMKSKGSWDGEWSVAKRRKKSGTSDKKQCIEPPAQKSENKSSFLPSVLVDEIVKTDGEELGKTLSVVEMVAYLEQRASEQQVDLKRPLLRSSATVHLTKGVSLLQHAEQICKDPLLPEVQDEESVRVLDMVAKLESQCLNRQSIRTGDLSRSNSFRRRVGRVLLAGTQPYSVLLQPAESSLPQDEQRNADHEKLVCDVERPTALSESCGVQAEGSERFGSSQGQHHERNLAEQETCADTVKDLNSITNQAGTVVYECSKDPPPGMLFFAQASPKTPVEQTHFSVSNCSFISKNTNVLSGLEHEGPLPLKDALDTLEKSLLGEKVDKWKAYTDVEEINRGDISVISKAPAPLRRSGVSHEFLETRFKIQLLLEPQQYMAFLPHHIVVKIFSLLPTESLAALKCTCHYFKFIIESYGIRPADSRWVNDPRYKDDPCKQCKKRYGRGDVSLCRWHHKPYCQALPYGPGYWMCCRGAHKDSPGCNVGLHDNRWVPAFHSISMPIYKKSRDSEDDV